jgi:hypothetical protein
MSLLTQNSTPAERAVGCTFAETFENSEAVARNGGTITGATINNGGTFPNAGDKILYSGQGAKFDNITKASVIAKVNVTSATGYQTLFTVRDAGAAPCRLEVGINTSNAKMYCYSNVSGIQLSTNEVADGEHTLAYIFDGTNLTFYVDGVANGSVAFTLGTSQSDVYVGNLSSGTQEWVDEIKWVKAFGDELTAQDTINYHNNSNYNYHNEAVFDIQMTAETYDPTNTRYLDVSSNANHADEAGNPVKQSKRGVQLDGSADRLTSSSTYAFTGQCLSFACLFKSDLDGQVKAISFHGLNTTRYGWELYTSSGKSLVLRGGATAPTLATPAGTVNGGKWIPVVCTIDDSGNASIYTNEHSVSGTVTAPLATAGNFIVGSYPDGTNAYDGTFKQFQAWDFCLTPLQAQDKIIEMLSTINQV